MKRLLPLIFLLVLGHITYAQSDSIYGAEIIRQLSSPEFKGRGYNQHGDSIAAEYLREQLRLLKVTPLGDNYYQHYSVNPQYIRNVYNPYPTPYHSQNVVGKVEGKSDSMIVFTAHYDHLGIDSNGVLYPGAHDNASGCGAVMALAKWAKGEQIQSVLPYTIIVMLFSGEEAGLFGSLYASMNPLIDYSKVKLLVNIDMFCGGDEGLMVEGGEHPQAVPLVERMIQANAEQHLAIEIKQRKNAPNSDHYPFTPLCPSIFIYTLGGPYGGYHSPKDTFEGCGLAHFNDYLSLIKLMAK